MPNNRREFLKLAGLTGMGLTGGGVLEGLGAGQESSDAGFQNNQNTSVIGLYGEWANSMNANKLPAFSFRKK